MATGADGGADVRVGVGRGGRLPGAAGAGGGRRVGGAARAAAALRRAQAVRQRQPRVRVHGLRARRVGGAAQQHRVHPRARPGLLRHGTSLVLDRRDLLAYIVL